MVKVRTVHKRKFGLELAAHAHLFDEATLCRLHDRFVGTRMAAARVCPKSSTVVFVHRTPVQQQVSFAVEDKHTEGPVQDALTVGLHLFHGAKRAVFRIYENHIFDHGLGLIGCE
jgi:hypothetical protein